MALLTIDTLWLTYYYCHIITLTLSYKYILLYLLLYILSYIYLTMPWSPSFNISYQLILFMLAKFFDITINIINSSIDLMAVSLRNKNFLDE